MSKALASSELPQSFDMEDLTLKSKEHQNHQSEKEEASLERRMTFLKLPGQPNAEDILSVEPAIDVGGGLTRVNAGGTSAGSTELSLLKVRLARHLYRAGALSRLRCRRR